MARLYDCGNAVDARCRASTSSLPSRPGPGYPPGYPDQGPGEGDRHAVADAPRRLAFPADSFAIYGRPYDLDQVPAFHSAPTRRR